MDAIVFDEILKNKIDIDYLGVDTSKSMLDMSIMTMNKFNVNKKFILADFFSRDFKNEILRLSDGYDNRIYTIFNNTFWNLNQTRVINTLNNILRSWDKLRIDIRMRMWETISDDLALFNSYCESLKRETRQEFFSFIFDRFSIPRESYSFSVVTRRDEVLWSLVFDFIAKFSKKTSFDVFWNNITILPGENFKINHIYTYDEDRLILFFEEHWFKIKTKFVDKKRWHFVFEKI